MPKHTLQMLVLLTAFGVAPATAGHRNPSAVANRHESACPYERARAEAAAAASAQAALVKKGPTIITLTERVPPESSLWAISRGSGVLNP